MAQQRPFLMFFIIAIAASMAIVFFRVYGRLNKSVVPLPISATIDHFAPGLAIGQTVKENTGKLLEARWVRGYGYVGGLPADSGFTHARLLLGPGDREKADANDDAPVEAIELVSTRSDALTQVMIDLGIVFRRAPKDGCIIPISEEMPYRRVQYWTTRNDLGGVALVTDWTFKKATTTGGVVVWSMMTWKGPFQGSKTLVAKFDPRSCFDVVGT
jgi:hypothetical protein